MQGMIQGGWGYVTAAYGLSWTILILYTASLWARARRKESP